MIRLLLWAGPLGIGLAVLLLLASASFFHHGPDVPTAGDRRAWTALWGASGVVALGLGVGLIANLVWLVQGWRRARSPGRLAWIRFTANVLPAIAFLWLWFGF